MFRGYVLNLVITIVLFVEKTNWTISYLYCLIVGSPILSLSNCSLSLIGLELDCAMNDSWNNSLHCHYKNLSLLNKCEVLNKLLAVGFFDVFDWNRHILLPFRRIVQSRQARSTPYPLTANSTNGDSTAKTAQATSVTRTTELQKSYKRILNNDSLFTTESEDDNSVTGESRELNVDRICGGDNTEKNDGLMQKADCATWKTNHTTPTSEDFVVIGNTTNSLTPTHDGSGNNLTINNKEKSLVWIENYTFK